MEKLLEAGKSVAQLSDELVVKEHDLELATIEVDKVKLKDFEFVVKVFLNTELFFYHL